MEFLRRKLAKKSRIQYINKIIILFISISRNYISLLWKNGLQYIIAMVIILLFSKNDNEIVTLFVNPLWGAKQKRRVLYKKPFFHLTVKKEKSLNLCSRYFFTLLNARRGFWHTLRRTTCKLQKTQVNFSLKMGACMYICTTRIIIPKCAGISCTQLQVDTYVLTRAKKGKQHFKMGEIT